MRGSWSRVVVVFGVALLGATGGCADDEPPTDGAIGDVVADAVAGDAVGGDGSDTGTAADTAGPADTAANADAATDSLTDTTTPPNPNEGWAARGPFRVGYQTETLAYEAADGSGERALRLVMWYPTRDEAGTTALYAGLLPADGVLGGATPAADLAPLPVVIFSHGNTSFAEQSYFFTEFLASHGFAVLAPDHTGNTFNSGSTPVAMFHWRPQDISAILDHLEALPTDHALEGLVAGRVAVSGHSFGGYTSLTVGGARWAVDAVLAFCDVGALPLGGCDALRAHEAIYREGFGDARIDALIPMSPGATRVFGATGVGEVTAPTLLFTAARDATTPNATEGDPTWAALASGADHLRVDFATGGHFTFSDACSLPIGVGVDDGCGETFLPVAAAHAAINAYSLAFLRRHLLADEWGAPLLDGAIAIEPDATVTRGGAP